MMWLVIAAALVIGFTMMALTVSGLLVLVCWSVLVRVRRILSPCRVTIYEPRH